MNQILEQFAKLGLVPKIGLLVLLMALLGTADYYIFYSPLKENLGKLKKTEDELNNKLNENKAIAKNK
jgi:Tfp pilus assembly protein PilO